MVIKTVNILFSENNLEALILDVLKNNSFEIFMKVSVLCVPFSKVPSGRSIARIYPFGFIKVNDFEFSEHSNRLR